RYTTRPGPHPVSHHRSKPRARERGEAGAPGPRIAAGGGRRKRESSARVLARTAAAARLVAVPEVEILGEPLLDQVIDGGVKGIQTAQLLTLELGKRSVHTR